VVYKGSVAFVRVAGREYRDGVRILEVMLESLSFELELESSNKWLSVAPDDSSVGFGDRIGGDGKWLQCISFVSHPRSHLRQRQTETTASERGGIKCRLQLQFQLQQRFDPRATAWLPCFEQEKNRWWWWWWWWWV